MLFFFIIPIENLVWSEVRNLKKSIVFYEEPCSIIITIFVVIDTFLYFNVGFYE